LSIFVSFVDPNSTVDLLLNVNFSWKKSWSIGCNNLLHCGCSFISFWSLIAHEDLTTDIKENAYLSVFNEWENQTKSVPTLDKRLQKKMYYVFRPFFTMETQQILNVLLRVFYINIILSVYYYQDFLFLCNLHFFMCN
jgi:hypothetical protein